jgi:membrane protease subunit HflC
VKWRIVDPRTYFVTFGGNERAASERLGALIRDGLNAAINKRTVNDVTSRDRAAVMQEIRESVSKPASALGVEIVDVRLKRVDFVPEISESVYRRMEAERKRVANEQRSIGAAEGERIRADAERQREVIVAEAYRKAQEIMGDGDAQASIILGQAFGQDREFFQFYRSLEAYRASFRNKSDVMVLDPSSEFFRFMRQGASGGASR